MNLKTISAADLRKKSRSRQPRTKRGPSSLEEEFDRRWKQLYPEIELTREKRFHEVRRYRFDFCHEGAKVGIEIQGGTWTKGAHSTGSGIQRDYEKSNLAQVGGWGVFSLTAEMMRDREALEGIAETIKRRGNQE